MGLVDKGRLAGTAHQAVQPEPLVHPLGVPVGPCVLRDRDGRRLRLAPLRRHAPRRHPAACQRRARPTSSASPARSPTRWPRPSSASGSRCPSRSTPSRWARAPTAAAPTGTATPSPRASTRSSRSTCTSRAARRGPKRSSKASCSSSSASRTKTWLPSGAATSSPRSNAPGPCERGEVDRDGELIGATNAAADALTADPTGRRSCGCARPEPIVVGGGPIE